MLLKERYKRDAVSALPMRSINICDAYEEVAMSTFNYDGVPS